MFSYQKPWLDPFSPLPSENPSQNLPAFYWHFVKQAKATVAACFILCMCLSLAEAAVPVLIGSLVGLLSKTPREEVLPAASNTMIILGALILIIRPLLLVLFRYAVACPLTVSFTGLVAWQTYLRVMAQPLTFFQSELPGRISSRVLQTARPLRDSLVSFIRSIWQILIFGVTSLGLMSNEDVRLAMPFLVWFICYFGLLTFFVPRVKASSQNASEARSAISGRIIDNINHILTVKLFCNSQEEDADVRSSFNHLNNIITQQQLISIQYVAGLATLNALLLAFVGTTAIWLYTAGQIEAGAVTTSLLFAVQLISMSGWVAAEMMTIYENVGIVQDGMATIAHPLVQPDKAHTRPFQILAGEIEFREVHFHHNKGSNILSGISFKVQPGERVGIIGRSGTGKTTLLNLILGFHNPCSGQVLIDNQDIRLVSQESLRNNIAVIAQDAGLLHRSVRENIAYGNIGARDIDIENAAQSAHCLSFIQKLRDDQGRCGFDAHVGERGIRLSGGQRQRIAIARAILRNSPIVIFDEATSALDSEVEAAVQYNLADLMKGRTVIAVAHRLSTLTLMDRLIVLDNGRIIEEGTHEDLVRNGGLYAALWSHQAGGFIQTEMRRSHASAT